MFVWLDWWCSSEGNWLIAEAFLHVIDNDTQLSVGALQMCVVYDAGSEAGIHAMRAIFEDNDTYGTFQSPSWSNKCI